MKKITLLLVVSFLFISCEKGILNSTPKNKYSSKTVWKDVGLARAYLRNAMPKFTEALDMGCFVQLPMNVTINIQLGM
jgi:hypothetical protein